MKMSMTKFKKSNTKKAKLTKQPPVFSREYMAEVGKKMYSSHGILMIIDYFEEVTRKVSFQADVKKFRERNQIPKNGFDYDEEKLIEKGGRSLPNKWIHASKDRDDIFWKSILRDESHFCLKYCIQAVNRRMLRHYLFYNVPGIPTNSICSTQDYKEIGINRQADIYHNIDYPILIRVSPYASLRDILDYIKISYTVGIKPLQIKYRKEGVRLGSARKKDPKNQARDDFIYKHRGLSRKELAIKVEQNFKDSSEPINEGSVGKIIAVEKGRREV